jgi:hypothetical protein
MLHCPKCRGEFEDWAKTCPDCHADLVAEPSPPQAQVPPSNPIRELKETLGNPRLLLILAGVTMLLALCGLISYCVGTAIGEDADAWRVTRISLFSLIHAIVYPGVLLSLAVLAVPSVVGGPAGVHRVFRVLVIAAIALVLVGVGEAITEIGQWSNSRYPDSRWYAAGSVSSGLAGAVFQAGVLVGLAYLCLRRSGALESPEAPPEAPEP